MRQLAYVLGLALLVAAHPARAGKPSEADRLYVEGVKLLATGELDAAVERFEAAVAIQPSAPLLYNLGQAQAKLGRLVAAKQSFVQALALAEKKGPKSILELASAALTELSDRIPSVTVDRPQGVADARVEIDGKRVEQLGTPIDLEPGKHQVVVTAEGYLPVRVPLDLREGDRERVRPKLVRERAPEAEPVVTPSDEEPARSLPVGPLVVGGVGLVALGAAGYFYLKVRSIDDERTALWHESGCPGPSCPSGEPEQAKSLREDAESKARLGNVLLGVGAAAVVAGGVWYYLSSQPPKKEASGLRVLLVPGGVVAAGRF